jgi:hypothetical protein
LQPLADARHQGGAARQAHRHVGAQGRCETEQLLFRQGHAPQITERAQRRGGIGRSAAEARRHRDMLAKPDRS